MEGGIAGSVAISQLHGPGFDPELWFGSSSVCLGLLG